ncbi:YusU family protein [Anaerobacillus sp. MEB173]|uniref:YusU family protein n=1 Tax=Anaerobacillus sp. MEB173 TaxID=3383345 RepID=UPI003F91C657
MKKKFDEQLDGLLEKYTELLLGESSPELQEKVKAWALYTHISKSMPPLAKHWNEQYPDAKETMKNVVKEIQELNKAHREKKNVN